MPGMAKEGEKRETLKINHSRAIVMYLQFRIWVPHSLHYDVLRTVVSASILAVHTQPHNLASQQTKNCPKHRRTETCHMQPVTCSVPTCMQHVCL